MHRRAGATTVAEGLLPPRRYDLEVVLAGVPRRPDLNKGPRQFGKAAGPAEGKRRQHRRRRGRWSSQPAPAA